MTGEDALAEIRRLSGPPYKMTIEFPPPVLTDEEEAAALAQAEYDDDMGNFGLPEGSYTELRAQTKEDARAEANHIWRTQPHDDNATGYTIWRADWGCVHPFRVAENAAD